MIAATKPAIKTIACPFTVLVDTREQAPYAFTDIWEGPAGKAKRIEVPTRRTGLRDGDYSIETMTDQIAIERKSKDDLYGSVAQRRANFVVRLERMAKLDFAAVVIEAEWGELLSNPPPHTQFSPKALGRTILAWMVRYPVAWIMAPSRDHAEAFTFRLLHRYWLDQQERPRERFDTWEADEPMSDPATEPENRG